MCFSTSSPHSTWPRVSSTYISWSAIPYGSNVWPVLGGTLVSHVTCLHGMHSVHYNWHACCNHRCNGFSIKRWAVRHCCSSWGDSQDGKKTYTQHAVMWRSMMCCDARCNAMDGSKWYYGSSKYVISYHCGTWWRICLPSTLITAQYRTVYGMSLNVNIMWLCVCRCATALL